MKKNRFFALVFCAVLFAALGFGCSNGSTNSPPEDLPDGWQTMSYEEWDTWAEGMEGKLSPAEQEAFIQYIQLHLSDLNEAGQKWWNEMIADMDGTSKEPAVTDTTIEGVEYSGKATTDFGTQYLLSVSYDEALAAFTEFFGYPPKTGWNIKTGSSLSSEIGWVIFEETDDDYRLVKYADPENIGVGWNKKR